MEVTVMNDLGALLPISNIGLITPEEVVDLHVTKLKKAKKVYLSTNINHKEENAKQLSFLLLVNRKEDFVYLAEISSYIYFENGGVPNDSKVFSPSQFSEIPCEHWYKLKSITKIEKEDLADFEMTNKKSMSEYGSLSGYLKNSRRIQLFYVRKKY